MLTESLASQHQVQVALAGDWQGRWAMADRRRLQQALLNLVSNAIKYNHPGGTVVLKLPAAATPGRLTLSVQDTGQGMSAEQIANLYQPFNRLGAERGQVEGTGLGLVIARQLLLAMGGDLTVESRPGAGSAFSVTLPSAPTPAAPQPVGQAPAQPAGRVAPVRPRTVLYVEDNPVNVALMEALLDTRPGVQLQVAEDGCAGLEAARRLQPDLILLDMHLPLMSGLEVLQHLRADPATAHLACVAVSANGMPEDIARARAEGFDDYVVKPIEPERLLALVDAIRA